MIKANTSRLKTPSGITMLLLLTCALPTASGTKELLLQLPPPTASQQLLIEIHGSTGVGWWSPPTRGMEFGLLGVAEREAHAFFVASGSLAQVVSDQTRGFPPGQ